jgi:protein SCO1
MAQETTATPRNSSMRYIILAVLVVSMAITGYLVFNMFRSIAEQQGTIPPTTIYTGRSPVEPARQLENFTLTGEDGQAVSLNDFRGKPTLLFFGFTHCPDVCPITLAQFKRIKVELDDFGDQVNYVFISVDPRRDTPEVTAAYVANFDERFVGLSGDEVTLRRVAPDYGLQFEYDTSKSETDYNVIHTGYSYLIDAEGKLRVRYDYGTEVEYLLEDVETMLAAGG